MAKHMNLLLKSSIAGATSFAAAQFFTCLSPTRGGIFGAAQSALADVINKYVFREKLWFVGEGLSFAISFLITRAIFALTGAPIPVGMALLLAASAKATLIALDVLKNVTLVGGAAVGLALLAFYFR